LSSAGRSRALALFGNQGLDRWALGNALQPSRFLIKPLQRPERGFAPMHGFD